jgi:hypothetical protein
MTLQHYLGTLTIDGDSKDFTIDTDPSTGPFALALTVGDYFIHGYTGEVAEQICEHLQAQIRTVGAFATATVAFDNSTALVTIDFKATCSVVWTDTDLRDLLGFTGNLSGASAYTATNATRGVWSPTLVMSEYPGDLTRLWGQRSTSRIGVSSDGTVYSAEGTILYDGVYGYHLLPEADVITTSATVWESLEQFWEDCIHTGKPIRVYPDKTVNTASDYVTALMSSPDGKVGGFHDGIVARWRENYNGFWSVNFMLRKYVT